MKPSEIEIACNTDGGMELAKTFGAKLASCGSSQLLAMAYAVIAQADGMPDFSEFTATEYRFLSMARDVVEAYTVREVDR